MQQQQFTQSNPMQVLKMHLDAFISTVQINKENIKVAISTGKMVADILNTHFNIKKQ